MLLSFLTQIWMPVNVLQIVSDICQITQKVPAVTIGASYGNAFLAGLGVGAFSTYHDINTWLRDIKEVVPNPENTGIYKKMHSLYRKLYRRTKAIMHEL